jgi:hypothetical protein
MALGKRGLKIIGAIVAALSFGGLFLRALQKVLAGHGADTYRNYKGALLNYGGVIVAFTAFAVCAAGAIGWAWWEKRRARKLDEFIAASAREADTPDTDSR